MRYKNVNLFLAVLIVLALNACGDSHFDQKMFKLDSPMLQSETHVFEFEIEDTLSLYSLGLQIGWDLEKYPYQNIYFAAHTFFPDGRSDTSSINVDFMDRTGQVLGECLSSDCNIDILLQERLHFNQIGKYKIALQQNTRDESIEGIQDVLFYLDIITKASK